MLDSRIEYEICGGTDVRSDLALVQTCSSRQVIVSWGKVVVPAVLDLRVSNSFTGVVGNA